MPKIKETETIVDTAVEALRQLTGLEWAVKSGANNALILQFQQLELQVEVRAWAPQMNTGTLIYQFQQYSGQNHHILVADYITLGIGNTLQQAGIQFIDGTGNAYINQPSVFICSRGNKPEKNKRIYKPGKAFQKGGLKVILAFLQNNDLINQPYRTIAEEAGIALGAVGEVIRDLQQSGYLGKATSQRKRAITNRQQLLQRWADTYPYWLREKHYIGTFTTNDPLWWQKICPEDFGAQWGGEVAAAKYTGYLNPKDALVYIPRQNMALFMKAAKLRKVKPHEEPDFLVKLFEPCWPIADNIDLAPPVIVYADLLETGDPRNLETANKLYEKHLG